MFQVEDFTQQEIEKTSVMLNFGSGRGCVAVCGLGENKGNACNLMKTKAVKITITLKKDQHLKAKEKEQW